MVRKVMLLSLFFVASTVTINPQTSHPNLSEYAESVVHLFVAFTPESKLEAVPVGSAFFITEDTIVSAAHVYLEAAQIINQRRQGVIVAEKRSAKGKFLVPVTPDKNNLAYDLITFRVDLNAITQSWKDFKAKPLPLAEDTPAIGDDLYIIGYFGGDNFPVLKHAVASGVVVLQGTVVEELLLDTNVLPGQSGAPAISKTGQVCGVALSSIQSVTPTGAQMPTGISRAATAQHLRELLSAR